MPGGFLLLSQTIRLRGADEEDGKKQTETRRERRTGKKKHGRKKHVAARPP